MAHGHHLVRGRVRGRVRVSGRARAGARVRGGRGRGMVIARQSRKP